MLKVLGIDPGSRFTGYGVVEWGGGKPRYVASGCIRVTGETLAERLRCIYLGVTQVVSMYAPHEAAIEQVFMARNADSALKLGQARGVAILAMAEQGLQVAEYSAKKVKQSVVGKGNAEKWQVQHMMQAMLDLQAKPQADAADALAIAVCHLHTQQSLMRIGSVSSSRRGRMR
ncbi:crossover junction endodeoxyribonuclease RuvC [Hahella aquimaris]|uniref:crossover junction endodeoxyribonuclease RuvC n=1 Tax=Hahella sp. HNIBRBA332 TaxID=3015983 RepID=UPI00273B706B|nr:crossover junction endodeoxyribonuclease RuvC [Hahella sp. HNIBRBA332]WLQ14929.1 crossover junction endodeoxyribonuclease RuvC [Hahella sp. HNIBRBA332]